MHRPLIALTTAVALAAPLAAVTSTASGVSSAASPSARASQVALMDSADDVWVWSEGTSSWELWGTKADADVLGAKVKHGAHRIRVVMDFDNLRKERDAGYLAVIKTPSMKRKAWVTADPQIGWNGEHRLMKGKNKVPSPGFRHKIDYQAETVVMSLPRALFDDPRWIRAKLRNDLHGDKDFTDNPHTTTWSGEFTGKIRQP